MRKVEPHRAIDGSVTYKVRFRHLGKQSSETFTAKAKADKFVKHMAAIGVQGALDQMYADEQAVDVPTLDELAAEYIELRPGIDGATRLDYERLWARTWGKELGYLRANHVTEDAVARAVQSLAKRYSYKSLQNQRGLLAAVCGRAVRKGYLAESPTTNLRLPRATEHEAEEMTFLTPAEFDILLEHVPAHWRPLVMMLAGTGMRWGEAAALLGRDITDDGKVRIIKAVKRGQVEGKRVIGPPKTKRSKRTITLPRQVIAVLPDRPKTADLFVGPKGAHISHQNFWMYVWRPALWRAQHCAEHTEDGCKCGTGRPQRCKLHDTPPPPCGCEGTLTKDPRIHDLRHSHASWLIAAGVPLPVIQRRLGHESITTTVDRYGHLMPDAQLAAAQAAELVFSPLQLES